MNRVSKASDPYAPQKRYAKKCVETGLVRLSVWVPEADREEVVQLVKKLRNNAGHS